jgi:hypothetical protein
MATPTSYAKRGHERSCDQSTGTGICTCGYAQWRQSLPKVLVYEGEELPMKSVGNVRRKRKGNKKR